MILSSLPQYVLAHNYKDEEQTAAYGPLFCWKWYIEPQSRMTVNSSLYTLYVIGTLTGDIQEETELKKNRHTF